MNQQQPNDLLQRYFDGDVSKEERAQVEARLQTDSEARREFSSLQNMRARLQQSSARWAQDLDSDALFARIEAGIHMERAPTQKLRAITGGAVKAPTRKAVSWTVFAVAAAALVGWLSWELLPSNQPRTAASEVIEVDFGDSAGKVMKVEGEKGQSVIVVWIDEDKKSF